MLQINFWLVIFDNKSGFDKKFIYFLWKCHPKFLSFKEVSFRWRKSCIAKVNRAFCTKNERIEISFSIKRLKTNNLLTSCVFFRLCVWNSISRISGFKDSMGDYFYCIQYLCAVEIASSYFSSFKCYKFG